MAEPQAAAAAAAAPDAQQQQQQQPQQLDISDEFRAQAASFVEKHNELLELQQRIKALKPEIHQLETNMFRYMETNQMPRVGVEGGKSSIGRYIATQISAVTAPNIRDAVLAEVPGATEEQAEAAAKHAMGSRKRKRVEQIKRIVYGDAQ